MDKKKGQQSPKNTTILKADNNIKLAPFSKKIRSLAEVYLMHKAPLARRLTIDMNGRWNAGNHGAHIWYVVPNDRDTFTKREFNPLNYRWPFAGLKLTLMIYVQGGCESIIKKMILAFRRDHVADFVFINPYNNLVVWNNDAGK